jgi:hypothetical protein
MRRWRVDMIGKRLQHIGTVDAPNELEAIEAAVKTFAGAAFLHKIGQRIIQHA